jgi:hypothetical protein
MVARIEHCAWSSRSGEALRSSTRTMLVDLGRRAHQLDDAADALEAHVRAIETNASRSDSVVR